MRLERKITKDLIFGLLQLVIGSYIIDPIQGVLDYPVAFTLVESVAITSRLVNKAAYLMNEKSRLYTSKKRSYAITMELRRSVPQKNLKASFGILYMGEKITRQL